MSIKKGYELHKRRVTLWGTNECHFCVLTTWPIIPQFFIFYLGLKCIELELLGAFTNCFTKSFFYGE